MRDKALIARCGDQVMHMRGAEGVAAKMGQHLANRAIVGDGIAYGLYPPKRITPVGPGDKYAAVVARRLYPRLLHIIKSVCIVGPHIHR